MSNSGKTLQTRIQLKHDIPINWTTAGNNNFKPLVGEAIIYDVDPDAIIYNNRAPKVKIGDGTKKPNDLIGLLNEYEEADDGYYSSFLYPGIIDIGAYQQEKSILLDSGVGININDNSDNLDHKAQITPQGIYFSHINSRNGIGFTKDTSSAGINLAGSLILSGTGSSQLVCKSSSSPHIQDEDGHSLFGLISNAKLSVGNTSQSLLFYGSGSRPTYNNAELGLMSDVNLKVAKAGDTMTGKLAFNMSNPHIEMKDTAYDTKWYFQAYQNQLAFGPTFASAVKTDVNGNMAVPGTVKVNDKVTLAYNSTDECLTFTFS